MTQKERSKLIKKCDVLHSRIVREKGLCEHCSAKDNLQCAHIIPRQHLSVRWDIENCLSLCYRCHIYWAHKYPVEFTRWLEEKWPGRYDRVNIKRNQITKVNLEIIYERLKTAPAN